MSYTARITTKNRSAICILVDRSGSMSENTLYDGTTAPLSEAVANCINRMIAELVARCKGDDAPRHYFDVAVVGYSGDQVYPLLPTTSDQNWFLSTTELASCVKYTKKVQKQRTMPDSRKVLTTTLEKVWVEAGAEYRTPMSAAFNKVHTIMRTWCQENPNSFPPMVINITDGEATDSEPNGILRQAQKLQGLSTEDGDLLLVNVHLCNTEKDKIVFPTSHEELPEDRNAKLLFDISSVMPSFFEKEINQLKGLESDTSFRGMAYNASVVDLIKMLNIGSSSINLIL